MSDKDYKKYITYRENLTELSIHQMKMMMDDSPSMNMLRKLPHLRQIATSWGTVDTSSLIGPSNNLQKTEVGRTKIKEKFYKRNQF